MAILEARLFGKRCFQSNGQLLGGMDGRKVQELFCYLLLYRQRPHARETLASVLWDDSSTVQSKTYLRKTLWQLQLALDSQTKLEAIPTLFVDAEWVQLNGQADIWIDVAIFEHAFAGVRGLPGEQITIQQAQALREAVALYHADLLEGWYQDWCLYERERLQQTYLAMLDKLMGYCEVHHDYDAGLAYGGSALRYDRAREYTYRRLMRLHFLAGDRTGALRQYDRCVLALREDLDAGPTEATMALYEQIRLNRLADPALAPALVNPAGVAPLPEVLGRLKQLHTALQNVQHQMEQEIQAIEGTLRRKTE